MICWKQLAFRMNCCAVAPSFVMMTVWSMLRNPTPFTVEVTVLLVIEKATASVPPELLISAQKSLKLCVTTPLVGKSSPQRLAAKIVRIVYVNAAPVPLQAA